MWRSPLSPSEMTEATRFALFDLMDTLAMQRLMRASNHARKHVTLVCLNKHVKSMLTKDVITLHYMPFLNNLQVGIYYVEPARSDCLVRTGLAWHDPHTK